MHRPYFQIWMNKVFKPLLRKCVLVFFDDIFVYSKTKTEHWEHLHEVFELMKLSMMYVKEIKSSFVMEKVDYLGHFISIPGVETDPKKVEAIVKWPVPKTVKEFRRFLGLTGYYRKFVKVMLSFANLCTSY